ncbi:MAG: Trk system potassium transporter TrkA [Candidatus Electrothrix sp. AW2]|jgi:trk system potassium uptake protein TrkA|nr:Trk system potassium transporter TrkA [Candidatus Electrothrix gigas]MCI5133867.1 Trk system potassium transporter TrkA [Candidatus Electrothrix gigas]MCI5179370.1 Trk system potassium transporter TrkA [Candidatus Electrothrix gigas]MCI5188587.1 Trk system potassium transporter TrkA [Candidatus Electrothrix gigas]MCI5191550.1 Trk system potassium transporter TrkA [Candidatus Electrothrix gigas]
MLNALKKLKKNVKESKTFLILGLGGIGYHLATRLLDEEYSVTVIEADPDLVRYADDNLDARIINGSAMSIDCWQEAGADQMDYMIAVTDNDAVNMMTCMIADKFGIACKIARVRSLDFGHKDSLLQGEDLKIDLFIHPEELAAQEIARLLKRTAGDEIIDIALGEMQVLAARIHDDSPLANKTLIEIATSYNEFPFRVVAISRGITTIIPGGHHEILPHDQILVMANKDDLPRLIELTGLQQQRRNRIMILGGGLVGCRLAELLGKDIHVRLIEQNEQRATELSSLLPSTEILHGDGSDKNVLEEAGLPDMDTFIATTGQNETNIMSCLLAKQLMEPETETSLRNLKKTICMVNNKDYMVLASTSGSDIVLNKKILAGNEILTYISRSELLSVMHMHGFDAEVVDLIAAPDAPITRKPLGKLDASFAGHIIIGSVFHSGSWHTAVGSTHIQEGYRAIVICNSDYLKEVRKMFTA